jgi:hypothetical protein
MTKRRVSPECQRIMDIWHAIEECDEEISTERLYAMTMDTADVEYDAVTNALVEWVEIMETE